MKAIQIESLQVVFPIPPASDDDTVELHIEAKDESGTLAIIQRFTKAEWEQIAKGRGYWHRACDTGITNAP